MPRSDEVSEGIAHAMPSSDIPAVSSSGSPGPPPITSQLTVSAIVILCVLIGLSSKSIFGVFCAAAATVFLLPFARGMALMFFAATFGFGFALSENPIRLGAFNVYAADAVLVFVLWAITYALASQNTSRTYELDPAVQSMINWLIVWCAYGLIAMAIGYSRSYSYDAIFGDYRRYCAYMLGFLAVVFLPFHLSHFRRLGPAILFAGGVIMAFCVHRIVTGQYPLVQEDNATGYSYARLMPLSEAGPMTLFVAYATALAFTTRSQILRYGSILICCMALPFMFLSGYRYIMALAVVTPIATLLFMLWLRRHRLGTVIWTSVAFVVLLTMAGLAAPLMFEREFEKMATDLTVRLQSTRATGEWRYWVWRQCIIEFSDNPVFGKGFGHDLVILLRGSSGEFLHTRASAHNTVLTVLYRAGIVGLIPFLMFHIRFLVYALKNVRAVAPEYQAIYVAFLVFTVSLIGTSTLQPFAVMQFVQMYLVMGFMVGIIRASRPPAAENPVPVRAH